MITLALTTTEAAEVREALLETKLPWSPTLDHTTKLIQALLDEEKRR